MQLCLKIFFNCWNSENKYSDNQDLLNIKMFAAVIPISAGIMSNKNDNWQRSWCLQSTAGTTSSSIHRNPLRERLLLASFQKKNLKFRKGKTLTQGHPGKWQGRDLTWLTIFRIRALNLAFICICFFSYKENLLLVI